MNLRWTSKGLSDLVRLYEFLATVDPQAAAKLVQTLTGAVARLQTHARLGEGLEQFAPREVRRIIVGQYEVRYEVQESTMVVLRLWHTRERR